MRIVVDFHNGLFGDDSAVGLLHIESRYNKLLDSRLADLVNCIHNTTNWVLLAWARRHYRKISSKTLVVTRSFQISSNY